MFNHCESLVLTRYAGIDDLPYVLKAVHHLASKWEAIGITLRVANLSNISMKFSGDPLKCLTAMLADWLKRQYDREREREPPSWKKLVNAVADPSGGNDSQYAGYMKLNYKSKFNNYDIVY